MCQEAILTWFKKILNVDCGTLYIDLIDGIIVEKLLNQFNQHSFPLKAEQYSDSQFVFNYARIKSLIENMSKFNSTLQIITPLKIVEGNDENELNKFVFNIIKVIYEWDKAKEALTYLRNDQIQYILDFFNKEEFGYQQQILYKQLIEYETINNKQEQQINSLQSQISLLEADIQKLQSQLSTMKEENASMKDKIEQLEMKEIGQNSNFTIDFLKQECLNYQLLISNLEKRNELQQQQIQILIQFEQKSKDLEQELQNQQNKKIIIDELQEKNQILKDQVKVYDTYSKVQKENVNLINYNTPNHTHCEQEILKLKNIIAAQEQQIRNQFQIKQYTQETPKIPKPKVNCLSEQKLKKTCCSDDKLQKQNDMLRQIISKFEIQQQSTLLSVNKSQRGKSLNN
ncbi:unnamed protein product (macronuclear) [Paramecium tetraurelia]|uniref:Calponin-homology (CH) domain-containing protein n=1 Tax=Paramecium tetraurelia TaxID=5888 RepID=A0C4L5_PARTE|nr:uncharacterized protein GSPATT00006231001 [Paramecium tetraurelia]CAK65732.1 unnamed protein product [Paramecium tetraurelia]|eukprot:XP_001433129.1 hypothetical protein (macronuclear) [Paramecium tetraurelia strain d4-2]